MAQKRLLVIDDEPDFASLVVTVATQLGYAAAAAKTAREFQEMVLAEPPDVIVLDIVMPEMDGVELMRWLVAQGCRGRVLITSGYNPLFADMAKQLGELGGQLQGAVLHKPVRIADLRSALGSGS